MHKQPEAIMNVMRFPRLEPFIASLTVVVMCCIANQGLAQEKGKSAREEIGIAAEGYSHNLESFKVLKCTFVATDAAYKSLEDAISGKPGDIIMVNQGVHVVSREDELYLLGCDPAIIDAVKSELSKEAVSISLQAVPCLNGQYLSDGHYKLDVSRLSQVAVLYTAGKGAQPDGSGLGTPFNIGYMAPPEDPGTLLRDASAGRRYGRFEGVQEWANRQVLVFAIGPSERTITERYYLDPTQGFLPLRNESYLPDTGQLFRRSYITRIRQLPGPKWYPERSLVVLNPRPTAKEAYRVREFLVQQLDTEHTPKAEDFHMVIPKGCQVQDSNDVRGVFIQSQDSTVLANELHLLAARLQGIEARHRHRLGQPTSPSWHRRFFWIFQGTVLAICLLAVAWRLFRKWRRRTQVRGGRDS
jgi:hypothetical protein